MPHVELCENKAILVTTKGFVDDMEEELRSIAQRSHHVIGHMVLKLLDDSVLVRPIWKLFKKILCCLLSSLVKLYI